MAIQWPEIQYKGGGECQISDLSCPIRAFGADSFASGKAALPDGMLDPELMFRSSRRATLESMAGCGWITSSNISRRSTLG